MKKGWVNLDFLLTSVIYKTIDRKTQSAIALRSLTTINGQNGASSSIELSSIECSLPETGILTPGYQFQLLFLIKRPIVLGSRFCTLLLSIVEIPLVPPAATNGPYVFDRMNPRGRMKFHGWSLHNNINTTELKIY